MRKISFIAMLAAAVWLSAQTAPYPGSLTTDQQLAVSANNIATSLAAAMASSDTVMTVQSAAGITLYMLLNIDSEIVQVTAINGTALTVTRHFDSTTAAAHVVRARVSGNVNAWHHNALRVEVEAIESALGPNLSNVKANGTANAGLFNFTAQHPGGSLIIGNNTITMTPVPNGVNGTDSTHWLYVSSGTGTAEACLITGGSGTAGDASGQIIINCANTHSGNWSVASATAGIAEAIQSISFSGGLVVIPAGSFNTYASVYKPRTVNIQGAGMGTHLTYTGLTGAAFILGDSGSAYTHEPSSLSNIYLTGLGYNTAAVGVLLGGDPAASISPSTLQGHDIVLRSNYIEQFGYGIECGDNCYSNSFYDNGIYDNGIGYYIGNATNCCSNEAFFGGRFLGNTTAALKNVAYAQIYGHSMDIEYNKRGFFEDGTSGGGIFQCSMCQWETYTSAGSDPECAGLGTGQTICGYLVDVETTAPLTLSLYGGNMYYSTANSSYRGTDYMFVTAAQLSLTIEDLGVGGVLSPSAGAVIDAEVTDTTHSTAYVRMAHYPSQNLSIGPLYTTTLVNAFVQNAFNGAFSGTCTFSGTTCTVTYPASYTYPAIPVCTANDTSAAAPIKSTPTTTQVVFTGGTGAGATDIIAYSCRPFGGNI